MKKKNIIILAVITLPLIALSLKIIFSKNTSSTNTNTPPSSNENVNNTLPQTIGNGSNNISQQAVTPEDVSRQIKSNIEAAKNQKTKVSEFTVKDPDGKIVLFRSFLQSSGLKIDESVLQLSDNSEYTLFNCSSDSSVSAAGLIFEVNKDQDLKSYVNSVDPLTENVKKWESKMFQGLSPLFFPGESFPQSPSFNETKFNMSNDINTVTIRFANLKADSGKTFSIDWSMFDGKIFISSNKDCLRKLLNKYQDQVEP